MIRVSAGILRREERILICQRGGDDAFAGKWEFPGGKIREGESAEEALVRELAEELDLEVRSDNLRLLETIRHEYPGGPRVELRFFHVLSFRREPVNRTFRRIEWVSPSQAPEYDFLEADRPLLERLADGSLLPET